MHSLIIIADWQDEYIKWIKTHLLRSQGREVPVWEMEKYEFTDLVKSGGFSRVHKATHLPSGQVVAVKNMYFQEKAPAKDGLPGSIIREVSILKDLDHENVVRLLEVASNEEKIYLVFESLDFDLKMYLKYARPRKERLHNIMKSFLRQILSGVAYLHSHEILHRDLKPENILVDRKKMALKVADFGISREIGVSRKAYTAYTAYPEVTTLEYLAPEILLGDLQYSYPVDIWAVGCIFLEIATGCNIFHTPVNTRLDQIKRIFSVLGTPDEKTWPGYTKLNPKTEDIGIYNSQDLGKEIPHLDQDGLNLVSEMLCLDPSKRITAHDALKHPYLTNP